MKNKLFFTVVVAAATILFLFQNCSVEKSGFSKLNNDTSIATMSGNAVSLNQDSSQKMYDILTSSGISPKISGTYSSISADTGLCTLPINDSTNSYCEFSISAVVYRSQNGLVSQMIDILQKSGVKNSCNPNLGCTGSTSYKIKTLRCQKDLMSQSIMCSYNTI